MASIFPIQSSPLVSKGQPVPATEIGTKVRFNNRALTLILAENKKNPFAFRSLLRRSRVGSAFDMSPDTLLKID
ncbi:hypothetical protein [Crocosphaera sp.]|uniref:hypothetical protein n=1 Tax=Crocosphaera sp. TaxID=2729996 RepID=UPI0026291924|nr:hypothetical protein [Crocosphaera sp.]MDJ0582921.1 hypothetical protein [Crocosphaera sp.]